LTTLLRIKEVVNIPFECIVVVDSSNDSTYRFVQDFHLDNQEFFCLVSNFGSGPASAIKFGISNSSGSVVVITMADGSDDPVIIPELVRLIERGVVIAAASRYMPGGQQIGAPFIKSILSKLAGRTLFYFRRVGTKDPTNSFKAYSRDFLNQVKIESQYGFEMGIELVAKAKRYSLPVAEIPTIWLERNYGNSNFKLWKWLPRYFRWYLYAFGPLRK